MSIGDIIIISVSKEVRRTKKMFATGLKLLKLRVGEVTDVMGRNIFTANKNQLFKRLS